MKQIYAASMLAVESLWNIQRKRSVAIRSYGFTLFCLAIMLSWSGPLLAQSGTPGCPWALGAHSCAKRICC